MSQLRLRWRAVASVLTGLLIVGVVVVALQQVATRSWPLAGANPRLAIAAAALCTVSLFLRVAAWQQLFVCSERPGRLDCTASVALAAIASAVVPAKLDYGLKVWMLHRLSQRRLAIEAVVVSICALGLVDAAALIPAAIAGAAAIPIPAVRYPMLVVAAVGIGCIAVFIASAKLAALPLLRRSRRLAGLATRLSRRIAGLRENIVAYLLLSASLWVRAGGLLMLLASLGISFSLTTALVFICLTAGSAFVPIPSFGLGAGTAALGGLGIGLGQAASFALAATMLSVGAAFALGVVAGAFYLRRLLSARLAAKTAPGA